MSWALGTVVRDEPSGSSSTGTVQLMCGRALLLAECREGYGLTAQQADKLLHGLWRAIPAGATNAQ